MDRQQWLEWRLDGIGASDAPVVMNVSPYKTRYELWEEKVNRVTDFKDNPSMKRGRDMEEEARECFENMTGHLVFPKNMIHPEYSWLRCSLDGLSIDGEIAVEIKCPSEVDHAMALNGKVPDKYFPQIQHQMLACNLKEIYYFSYRTFGAIVLVKRDQKYIDTLFEEEKKFFDMILTKTPPEKTDRDIPKIEDPKWEVVCKKRQEITEIISDLEEESDMLKKSLIEMADDKSCKGFGFFLQKQSCKGAIDYDSIKRDYPNIDFEAYRKKPFDKWTLRSM